MARLLFLSVVAAAAVEAQGSEPEWSKLRSSSAARESPETEAELSMTLLRSVGEIEAITQTLPGAVIAAPSPRLPLPRTQAAALGLSAGLRLGEFRRLVGRHEAATVSSPFLALAARGAPPTPAKPPPRTLAPPAARAPEAPGKAAAKPGAAVADGSVCSPACETAHGVCVHGTCLCRAPYTGRNCHDETSFGGTHYEWVSQTVPVGLAFTLWLVICAVAAFFGSVAARCCAPNTDKEPLRDAMGMHEAWIRKDEGRSARKHTASATRDKFQVLKQFSNNLNEDLWGSAAHASAPSRSA